MKRINIYCIIGTSGSGKSYFMNSLLEDKRFMNKADLAPLVYGTTRAKRVNEVEGVDYYFSTKDEFKKIPPYMLAEYRTYYTINNGEVYYYTKAESFMKAEHNILCITSPYQYESYKKWIADYRSINKSKDFAIHAIRLDVPVVTRIERIMRRQGKDDSAIYEMCRRILDEREEFNDVSTRLFEINNFTSVGENKNLLIVDNSSDEKDAFKANIDKIKEFILTSLS